MYAFSYSFQNLFTNDSTPNFCQYLTPNNKAVETNLVGLTSARKARKPAITMAGHANIWILFPPDFSFHSPMNATGISFIVC
jgi:hypothetical protein